VLMLRETPDMPSWSVESSREKSKRSDPVDVVLVHMMTIGHTNFMNM
jgi:hypothetical protein